MGLRKPLENPHKQGPKSIERKPAEDNIDGVDVGDEISPPVISDQTPEDVAAEEKAAAEEEAKSALDVAVITAPERAAMAAEAEKKQMEAYLALGKGGASVAAGIPAGMAAKEIAFRTPIGNWVSPGFAGTVAAMAAGAAAQIAADEPLREALGLSPATDKHKVAREAILDELAGQGMASAMAVGGKALAKAATAIANNTEFNKVKALADVEIILKKLESASASSLTKDEVNQKLAGVLSETRRVEGEKIGAILNSAAFIERQSGHKGNAEALLQRMNQALSEEGAIFDSGKLVGFVESAKFPYGHPQGNSARNQIAKDYNNLYNLLSDKKGVGVIDLNKISDLYENMAADVATKAGDSTNIQRVFSEISSAANEDRDNAFAKLLVGTPYESTWKKTYEIAGQRIGVLKEAQNAFASDNIANLVINDTGAGKRAKIVQDIYSVFGANSEPAAALKNAFIKNFLTHDPAAGVINPHFLLRKIESSKEALRIMFAPEEIIQMKRFAAQAGRLNSARFGKSAGAEVFATDAISLASQMPSPKAASRALFDLASSNVEVYKKISTKLLERAKNSPPRNAEWMNEVASDLSSYLFFSVPEETKFGTTKLVATQLLKKMMQEGVMAKSKMKQSERLKKEAYGEEG